MARTAAADTSDRVKNVTVLGSTGSIGASTLEVIAASAGKLRAWGLSGHSKVSLLRQQAERHAPRWIVPTDPEAAAGLNARDLPRGTRLLAGAEGVERIASDAEVDVVVTAIVGSAGLRGTWAALEAGKTVALANKETLVVAGPLVARLASRHGAQIVPVDSEHSAIFQALKAGRAEEVRRIVLTASGGPFRLHTREQMASATVAETLAHPTWAMGPKITVDSATMMNKALEIIEARWLFDLPVDKIDVVVHPQSVVHSLVEYVDGAVMAQLSPPDMKLPIQYALSYPRRTPGVAAKLDWNARMRLDFEPPDEERFPALALGREAAAAGGTAGAVLNAANEAAVAAFLEGALPFLEIVPWCRRVLEHHDFDPNPTLDRLMQLDRWARQEVTQGIWKRLTPSSTTP